jgi:hypothetical protein
MKKLFVLFLLLGVLLCATIRAESVFFNGDGSPTDDCVRLFDALNFPVNIVDAESCSKFFKGEGWSFLRQNSWLDGKYPNSRNMPVNFNVALDLFGKMGVVRKNMPLFPLQNYNYIMIVSETMPEMLLNYKFFTEEILAHYGEIRGKLIFIFQPEEPPVSQCGSMAESGKSEEADLSFAGLIKREWEKLVGEAGGKLPGECAENFAHDMQDNVRFVSAPSTVRPLKGPESPKIEPKVANLFCNTLHGIAYGMIDLGEIEANVLVISSAHSIAKRSMLFNRIIESVPLPVRCAVTCFGNLGLEDATDRADYSVNANVVGYEVTAFQANCQYCFTSDEFSAAMLLHFFRLANQEITTR